MIKVIKFSKDNCRPCQMLAKELAKLDFEKLGATFEEFDVEKYPEAVDNYDLFSVPVLVFEKDGKEITRLNGYVPVELVVETIGGM